MSDTPPNPYVHPLYIPETDDREDVEIYGMKLRDYFAGQALAGLLAGGSIDTEARVWPAIVAYQIADAMLAERAKE